MSMFSEKNWNKPDYLPETWIPARQRLSQCKAPATQCPFLMKKH